MGNAIRWTQAMLDEFEQRRKPGAAGSAKPAKHRNRKVRVGGVLFDSQKEADRWGVLQQLERAGVITELRRQVRFELAPSVHLAGEAKKKPALRYYADAVYMRDGQKVVEDTKSAHTRKLASYRNKKHLMKTVLNLDITEV